MQFTVCNQPDREIFSRQCKSLENVIPGLALKEHLEDVDGSETAVYIVGGQEVIIHNSYYIGAVYIETDANLDKYFGKEGQA